MLKRLVMTSMFLAWLFIGFMSAPAHAQTDAAREGNGLQVSSSTVFVPDLAGEKIDVAASYTMTNVQADEVVGDSVRSYYFTKWVIAMPSTVIDFQATSNGQPLVTSIDQDPDSDDVVFGSISLPFNLNFEQTVTIDITYTIPGGEPRAEGADARVNDSFLSFSVWAAGDPGAADVRVDIPEGFTMDLQGSLDGLQEVSRDGEMFLEAVDIADPRDFFGQVFGRNDSGLLTLTAELPDATATVRAWPDDPDWATFVVDAIEDDVPVIEELTGLAWPAGDIEVIETVTPYLYGYGGWFNATSGRIEVGENLERDLILHELTHAWFNDDLIDGRWLTEGLAEEFASRTIEATGGPRPDPDEPDLDDPLRVQLSEWASPWTLGEEDAFAYEQYHYNAAWWVMRQITSDVGLDAFSDVLVALQNDEMAYVGEGLPEATTTPTSWIHLFDLLELQADAEDLDDLFATYVLSEREAASLDKRREQQGHYDEVLIAGDTWAAPLVVRQDLSAWRFDAAEELLDQAKRVLAQRDDNDAMAAELDVVVTHPAEMRYEQAASLADLETVHALETELQAQLLELSEARNELTALATELDTQVVFAPATYDEAVRDVAAQRVVVDELTALRARVETRSDELGLVSPAWQPATAPTDFEAAAGLADARLATLETIDQASRIVDARRSFVERVGLWRSDPNQHITDARVAFEADELSDALSAAGNAETVIAAAEAAGRRRLTWTAIAICALIATVLAVSWTRRRGGVAAGTALAGEEAT